jgi:hypothetical protein
MLTAASYLFVFAIASVHCLPGSGGEDQERQGPGAGQNSVGGFGNLPNFGDMAGLGGMFKGMTDGPANMFKSMTDGSTNMFKGMTDGGPAGMFKGMTDGSANMFKGMTDAGPGGALSEFMNSFAGPKVVSGSSGDTGSTGGSSSNSGDKRGAKEKGGFLGMKDPMDFFKLMLNPMELMNRIARAFNLDRGEFTQAVGRGMNFGLETALQPPIVCVKIIEKVFVPDTCKLKFVCDMGKQMAMFKGQLPKFPDSYFEGAATAKALYDGASGRDCDHTYACDSGEGPKLKKEFAGLKQKQFSNDGADEQHGGDSGDYAAASQQSKVATKVRQSS